MLSNILEYDCTQDEMMNHEDEAAEPDDPNYSPVLEISSTTTTRLESRSYLYKAVVVVRCMDVVILISESSLFDVD